MKALIPTNPIGLPPLDENPGRTAGRLTHLLAAAAVTAAAISLSGCNLLAVRRHAVARTVRITEVLTATLEQLNDQIAKDYAAIQTINASVDIKATSGGEHQGEVKELPTFAGYILLRKPSDLRVLMLLPLVRSKALDMVSDGKTFRLVSPPEKMAREGSEEVTTPSKKGLENLRPNIIRNALLVPPLQDDELVSLTQNARILPPAPGKKESTEEPDYDLTVTRKKSGNELQTIRVIHISRVTLKPYEQDIYDPDGRIATIVTYDKYQKYGDIPFPGTILITRPIDEYSLRIDITKLTFNEKMDDEEFVLPIPDNIPVTKM
jgi:outer membrane lipoprotein-sorting protein